MGGAIPGSSIVSHQSRLFSDHGGFSSILENPIKNEHKNPGSNSHSQSPSPNRDLCNLSNIISKCNFVVTDEARINEESEIKQNIPEAFYKEKLKGRLDDIETAYKNKRGIVRKVTSGHMMVIKSGSGQTKHRVERPCNQSMEETFNSSLSRSTSPFQPATTSDSM